jgi:putative ABC transport system substrate-binding protein
MAPRIEAILSGLRVSGYAAAPRVETDPVASGVVATLARPGGNVTGVFLDLPDFAAKWMEMLLECNPKLSRAAALWDPDTGTVQRNSVRKAAGSLNVQLEMVVSTDRRNTLS